MNARSRMIELWKKGRFDDDCRTVEEYADRVAERLKIVFGTEVRGVEDVYTELKKLDMI